MDNSAFFSAYLSAENDSILKCCNLKALSTSNMTCIQADGCDVTLPELLHFTAAAAAVVSPKRDFFSPKLRLPVYKITNYIGIITRARARTNRVRVFQK